METRIEFLLIAISVGTILVGVLLIRYWVFPPRRKRRVQLHQTSLTVSQNHTLPQSDTPPFIRQDPADLVSLRSQESVEKRGEVRDMSDRAFFELVTRLEGDPLTQELRQRLYPDLSIRTLACLIAGLVTIHQNTGGRRGLAMSDISTVQSSTSIVADLRLDSGDRVELIMLLEEGLGFEITDEEAAESGDAVGEVCIWICKLYEKKRSEAIDGTTTTGQPLS